MTTPNHSTGETLTPTPRTDAQEKWVANFELHETAVRPDFTRQLERELTASLRREADERDHAERLASFVRASLEHLEYLHERIPAHLGSEGTPDVIYELTAALQSHEARKQQSKISS
jgi:hypothetical protein